VVLISLASIFPSVSWLSLRSLAFLLLNAAARFAPARRVACSCAEHAACAGLLARAFRVRLSVPTVPALGRCTHPLNSVPLLTALLGTYRIVALLYILSVYEHDIAGLCWADYGGHAGGMRTTACGQAACLDVWRRRARMAWVVSSQHGCMLAPFRLLAAWGCYYAQVWLWALRWALLAVPSRWPRLFVRCCYRGMFSPAVYQLTTGA